SRIAEWDYVGAIAPLRRYLRQDLSTYDRTVAEVNLAAAFVYEGHTEAADQLLQTLEIRCNENRYLLALGRVFELRAENLICAERYDEAEALLARIKNRAEALSDTF